MDELEAVIAQERLLTLPRLDEDVAFALAAAGRDVALRQGLAVVIDVRSFDRQLAFLAMPGTAASNGEWVRRKSNTVRRFLKSSYRIVLERGGEGVFPPQFGIDAADFVVAGGSFPLRVDPAGVVGAITVSGLSGRDDHNLAVEILAAHTGVERGRIALPE